MSDQEIEDLVETIMRQYYMGSYEAYMNEEIRNKWKEKLRSESDETVVQQQSGRGERDR